MDILVYKTSNDVVVMVGGYGGEEMVRGGGYVVVVRVDMWCRICMHVPL